MGTLLYLEGLQNSKLLMLIVHFKGYSKKSLNAVEPEAVINSRHLQTLESECCGVKKTLSSVNRCMGISVREVGVTSYGTKLKKIFLLPSVR